MLWLSCVNFEQHSQQKESGNDSENPCGSFLFYSLSHGKNSEFGLVWRLEFVLN